MSALAAHANLGQTWERMLALQHRVYLDYGIARIDKYPTPVAVGSGRPIGTALADFTGYLFRGGRCVVIEAKECSGPSLVFSRLRAQQRDYLDDCEAAGGIAAVVISWRPDLKAPAGSPRRRRDEAWAVPWEVVRVGIAEGASSLRWEPDSPWRVPRSTRGPVDYLKALGVC